jgi:putative nucleotidyltransferase with HDIG domain
MARLNQVLDDPDVSVDEVVRLISLDQSLTTRILKVVNSAYYGLQGQVSTIRHALMILGFGEIQQVVLGTTVIDLFHSQKSQDLFDVWRFWEHSLGCAFMAKNIARILHYRISGETFVAGLLHDVGKIVLTQYFPEKFSRVVSQVMDHGVPSSEAETTAIGTTHGGLGHLLADHWNLPPSISEAIYRHHEPAKSLHNPLMTAIIHLADVLLVQNGRHTGVPWVVDPTIDRRAWEILKKKKIDLNETDLDRFSMELKQCQEQIDEFLQRPPASSSVTDR